MKETRESYLKLFGIELPIDLITEDPSGATLSLQKDSDSWWLLSGVLKIMESQSPIFVKKHQQRQDISNGTEMVLVF